MENETSVIQEEKRAEKPESYFDGGFWQLFGWTLLGAIVTSITLGICYPVAVCWICKWETEHTVIDGRRLKFAGRAGGLFGTWLLCILLTIITLGIYGFYVPIKIKKWREANTFFADELPSDGSVVELKKEKVSYFDGGFWQFFGWTLLGDIVTGLTLGICYPLAVKWIYSWEQRHKVYNKRRCTFDGKAGQLFGTWLLCILFTIITLGIYGFYVPIKIRKWIVKHTHLLESEAPAVEQEKTSETISKSKNPDVVKFSIICAAIVFFVPILTTIVGIPFLGGFRTGGFRTYYNQKFINTGYLGIANLGIYTFEIIALIIAIIGIIVKKIDMKGSLIIGGSIAIVEFPIVLLISVSIRMLINGLKVGHLLNFLKRNFPRMPRNVLLNANNWIHFVTIAILSVGICALTALIVQKTKKENK